MELQSLMVHTHSLEEQLEQRDQEYVDLQAHLHEVSNHHASLPLSLTHSMSYLLIHFKHTHPHTHQYSFLATIIHTTHSLLLSTSLPPSLPPSPSPSSLSLSLSLHLSLSLPLLTVQEESRAGEGGSEESSQTVQTESHTEWADSRVSGAGIAGGQR